MKTLYVVNEAQKKVLLGSREGMKFAIEKVVPLLDNLDNGEVLCIDLEGVSTIDDSFANQAFAVPLRLLKEENRGNESKFMYFRGANNFVKSVLDRSLERYELLAILNLTEGIDVIGSIGLTLINIVRQIYTIGEVSFDNLPSLTGLDSVSCTNRIKKLVDCGVITEQTKKGKKTYSTIVLSN